MTQAIQKAIANQFTTLQLGIPQGKPYLLAGNESVLLNDPQTVWLVKSGSMAIFTTGLKDGVPEGSRRYLFTVGDRQAMFSTPVTKKERKHLIAVSMEETELVGIPAEDFSRWLSVGDGEALVLVDAWIDRLGLVFAEVNPPKLPVKPENSNYCFLGEEDIFQSQQTKVVWVRLQQGEVKWLGFEEFILNSASEVLPLAADMWLQATEMVEMFVMNTDDLRDPDSILCGLTQLQNHCLDGIKLLDAIEHTEELRRFQQRQRLNEMAMADTLGALSSALNLEKKAFSETKTATDPQEALLMAAGAVGRALGITIKPPARSEDLRRVAEPLEAIARASRIRMRRISLSDKWWTKDVGSILAYTAEEDIPVALLQVGDNKYEIYNPVTGSRTPINSKNAPKLAKGAYVFYRSLPDRKDLKTLDLLAFALRGHFKELFVVLLAGVATTLLGMITPQATAILIDSAIPDANRTLLLQIGFALLAAAFGEILFQLTESFALMRLETFAEASTQAAVWDRLLNMKPSFFRKYAIGDLNSRVTAVTQIHQKLSGTVLKSIFSGFFAFLNLGLLFYYSPMLALLACCIAFLNIGVTVVSGILTVRKVRPLLEMEGQIFGLMVQLINGVSKLRVSGAESRAFAYWGKQYSRQIQLMLSTQSIEDIVILINKVLPALTSAALFLVAASMVGQSNAGQGTGISTGVFLAFNSAFGSFIGGATTLSTTIVDILEIIPLWQRAEPIIKAEPEVTTSKTDPGRLSGRILVEHVVFRYRSDGPLTLDDVSIRAEPGEFLAFVGPSGSGKSTLLRLLLGFDIPESGTIYYDGQDLGGLDVNAVRRQLGVVIQNSRLMSGSIFENISGGALISMDEAWEAAYMAGFAEDIESMPMGMHTVVSEGGSNISGGQRQRLSIARALALKPRILFFDEATSALDNKTQAIVSESLEKLKVTRIAIAHRLSTIRNADRIYVLQGGRIIQEGSFDRLAKQQGLFAQLMMRQMI
jgi:NHLM bacteriocin system ABC transporter ATP-binding protein